MGGSLTLAQKYDLLTLKQASPSDPAVPVHESYISRTPVSVVPQVQDANGRELEPSKQEGLPYAWTLPPGSQVNLSWRPVVAATCGAPFGFFLTKAWKENEQRCIPNGPLHGHYDTIVVDRLTSLREQWTRQESSLRGEAAMTWDAGWASETKPRHAASLAPQALNLGAEPSAQFTLPCQGLY
jgi:hypothetical protein